MTLRFDGYSATTQAANPHQLIALFGEGFTQREGRGYHSFGHKVSIVDESGTEAGSVMWGGAQRDRSMIEVKGEHSPRVVEALRGAFPHRATRLDACADFDAPGAFERLDAACVAIKGKFRLKGEQRGDWLDFPELGRTRMLGGVSAVSRLRLYEKGKQPEYVHLAKPDWARIEAQVRPAKDAKDAFAKASPQDVWGASPWLRELAGLVLLEHIDPHPAGTIWRKTSLEHRLTWICRQAGPTLLELLAEVGTWECLGLTLGEKVRELREGKELE